MGYTKDLESHLAAYKISRLGVKEPGVFLHKGREVRCAHVLPRALKWLNILEPIRTEVRSYLKQHPDIRLHKYFHHLNSSQAFAFNLFFPFFEEGDPAALLRAMGLQGTVNRWLPEYIPYAKEGTNVDVSWQDAKGAWTYCEVKLSEQEFGKARDDKRHREKLATIYLPVLAPYCPAELLQTTQFFANYQVLRNVWLAARDKTASVVFLYPAANAVLTNLLQDVTMQLHPTLLRRVHVVTVEDVLSALSADKSVPPRLSWYVDLLTEKYVPKKYAVSVPEPKIFDKR